MALQTDIIAISTKFEAMGFVAIAACHACLEHPALNERAVLIDFSLDLAVREIEVLVEQRNAVVVAHWLAVDVVFVNLAATRMASRAHLDFPLRFTGPTPANFVAGRVGRPGHSFTFVKRNSEPVINFESLPFALLPRP